MFPSFSGAFVKIFFPKPPSLLPWKISGCAPAFRHYTFCKTLHLKYLTVFWILLPLSLSLSLDNCLVICKITLCYVLHQTHSEFWHIQHSIFCCCCCCFLCRHMESYSALLRNIHAYWGVIRAYSGLFRYIQNPV